jgi:methanethiol S-methyltransferase
MTMTDSKPATGLASVDVDPSDTPPKVFAFLFGAAIYLAVWIILIYVVGFVGNFFTPLIGTKWAAVLPLKSIDMGIEQPFWKSFWIDIGLIAILGLQHSIMPRPWYKAWITKFVPPHMERGVYIIFAICALSLLMWQWRPLPEVIWKVDNRILRIILDIIQVCGWLTVLLATVQVGHWKIFGVTQTLDYIRDKPYTKHTYSRLPPEFFAVGWPITDKGLWYFARHPDFFGFCMAFWVTPTMTYGHLIFAVGLTIYIMFGIHFLEINLTQLYGTAYAEYVRVRSKIIPWFVKETPKRP